MSLTRTFHALAEPNRRRILDLLKKGEQPVSAMLQRFSVTMPTLSHHLDVLRRADLVGSRRQGRQIIYFLKLSVLEEAAEQAMKFFTKNN